MATMLVVRNDINCLHKNRVLYPKDGNFIVLTTKMAAVKTIYGRNTLTILQAQIKICVLSTTL